MQFDKSDDLKSPINPAQKETSDTKSKETEAVKIIKYH